MAVKEIRKEMSAMCSYKAHSVLRKSSPEVLQSFDWKDLIHELEKHAPMFLSLLKGCIAPKKSSKSASRRQPKYSEDAIVGMCAAIILRYRNQRLNLIQRILSVILYCGHSAKLVSGVTCKLFANYRHSTCVSTVHAHWLFT